MIKLLRGLALPEDERKKKKKNGEKSLKLRLLGAPSELATERNAREGGLSWVGFGLRQGLRWRSDGGALFKRLSSDHVHHALLFFSNFLAPLAPREPQVPLT